MDNIEDLERTPLKNSKRSHSDNSEMDESAMPSMSPVSKRSCSGLDKSIDEDTQESGLLANLELSKEKNKDFEGSSQKSYENEYVPSPPSLSINELIENADNAFQGTSEKSKQSNKGPKRLITSIKRVSNYLNTAVTNCKALYIILICVL